jgi:ATP-binding cassette subfamily F protein uup
VPDTPAPAPPRKLSFNERRELQELPSRIAALERELEELHARVQSAGFYKEDAAAIAAALQRLEDIGRELDKALARWSELDDRE